MADSDLKTIIKPHNKSGSLLKWTNYWNGWQPRWFVLKNGYLSYYLNSESVTEGCKGSMCVADAQITVNSSDLTRWEMRFGDDRQLQLKALTPHDRQQWLIALGSLKTTINTHNTSKLILQPTAQQSAGEAELRLYRDLLLQRVAAIKTAVQSSTDRDAVVQSLEAESAALSDTCDQFVRALHQCMLLLPAQSANGNDAYLLTQYSPPASGSPQSSTYCNGQQPSPDHSKTPPPSAEPNEGSEGDFFEACDSPTPPAARVNLIDHNEDVVTSESASPTRPVQTAMSNGGGLAAISGGPAAKDDEKKPDENQPCSVFAKHKISFMTIVVSDDGSVDTCQFLAACTSLTCIFDILGSTAFAPVKMDLNGNIRKLRLKYETNPTEFACMQRMIEWEVERRTTTASGSATDALLWLKRGVSFVREFLVVFDGGAELVECANKAYARTLRRHHAWVVRGVFSLACNALPDRRSFIGSMFGKQYDVNDIKDVVQRELRQYVDGIDRCLLPLNQYYAQHRLDPDLLDKKS